MSSLIHDLSVFTSWRGTGLSRNCPRGWGGLRVVSFDGSGFNTNSLSEVFLLEWYLGVGGLTNPKILQDKSMLFDQWIRKDHGYCTALLNTTLAEMVQWLNNKVDLDDPFLSKNSLKCLFPRYQVFFYQFTLCPHCLTAGLRNYHVRESTSPDCSIHQAIHAILAGDIHLPAISIQDEQFIGATSAYANPSHERMKELSTAFPKASVLACFINFGTGRPVVLPIANRGTENDKYIYCSAPTLSLRSLAAEDSRGMLNLPVEAVGYHVTRLREDAGKRWVLGKIIIMSYVILTLLDLQAEYILLLNSYFECSPLRSLVARLSVADGDGSRQLYQKHKEGANQPQLTTLHTSLNELDKASTLSIYNVGDAPNEFPFSQCKYLPAALCQLSNPSGLRPMVTNLDEWDTHQTFSSKASFAFAFESEMVH
ncbi:hypothetical protein DL96DRAFT_1556618 [Flagelloscypha sp. PMI_526]|nr:hypothetical protein DL96DRAFT_1556618 [Flagelloscypha sp. PMI_526]